MKHHRVVVQIARVQPERGEAGGDPIRNGIVRAEVSARMRHDHDGARFAGGRQIKDAARFAEVRSVKLHGALAKRRIDVAEVDWIPQLVISRRFGHVASPELARERDS